jgi:hypothetical protein
MKKPIREDLFSAIAELGKRYPQWRVGQLIANVAGWVNADVWDVEDDSLLETIQRHLAKFDEPVSSSGAALRSMPVIQLEPIPGNV